MRQTKQTNKQKKNKKQKQVKKDIRRQQNNQLREESEVMDNTIVRNEIEESNEYSDICKQIRKYIPDANIEFRFNQNTQLLEIVFIEKEAITGVLKDNTWDEIKRNIDYILSDDKQNECKICCGDIKNRVGCTRCSSPFCSECYVNLFKTGQGIIKCPFCRFEYGHHMDDQELIMGEMKIRAKLYNGI